MKKIVMILGLMSCFGVARAAMVSSDSIGNDPAKVKLCAARAQGTPVPFEIDSRYVEESRATHPDTTFVAIDGSSPQLVECYLRDGTGKYEPASMSPEQAFWHVLKPKQFDPGIDTPQGREMAAKVCLDAGTAKINRPDFDHSVYSSVVEVTLENPRDHSGAVLIGKAKAVRYDIVVNGTSFYKSSGPDLAAVNITCLLSPMLKVKGINAK